MAFTTNREAVTAIFIGYFGRAPAPNGLNFWVNDIENEGFTVEDVARAFAVQPEAQAAFPGLTTAGSGDLAADVAFVTAIFQNLFGRDPNNITENGGADNFWVAALQGGADVGQLIIDIISGAQGGDLTIIQNKIAVGLAYADASEAANNLGRNDLGDTILDDVNETDASVVAATSTINTFFGDGGPGNPGVPGETFILSPEAARDNLTGTEGNDTFEAFNGELQDGDRMDGGSGTDVFTYFSSEDFDTAVAPITTSVEQVVVTNQTNDLFSQADNNVGGYSGLDGTVEVDVEIDAGMMSGVTRWEDYDSRADLVIEDARDQDDTDGTFTGDITVAMVSTDPGNVDYAVYFDQPVNTSQNFGTLEIRVLDQEAAFGLPAPSASSTGYLTESSLIEFTFAFDGQPITVELADEEGVTYGPDVSFQDLLNQVEAATQQALVDAGVTENLGFSASLGAPVSVGVGNQFTLPLVLTFDVPADTIAASSDDIIVLGRDSGNNGATPATDTFGSLSTVRITEEELIRLNVELDDVGKGSMGGDALFGAMSTGRQTGDDGTSDSIGIQQFDIEVDRSSQLQTINSTNNALEVVNIVNGENDGPNNTTTAADEMIGDLVVRGVANPGVEEVDPTTGTPVTTPGTGILINTASGVATDSPMPGAVPQHDVFGFTDVRVINAAAMVGAVDLTVGLTEEIVEKYLDIADDGPNGEADDVLFSYALGTNDDEFLINLSSDALNSAGTGSREDFDMSISGGAGNDVITTNIGGSDEFTDVTVVGANTPGAVKMIDEQGQDYYVLESDNAEEWYTNQVSNVAAEFSVDGGAGNDTIWTHGWGDFTISDGSGADVVYTDNSAAEQASLRLATNIDRNLTEHDQIDYVIGDVWAFNAEILGVSPFTVSGATNEDILLATLPGGSALIGATSGNLRINVSFDGATGSDTNDYTVGVDIPFSEISISAAGAVTITEQALNQAIKNAVNNDAILSNLMEAADGPGNSLIVATKVDGDYEADDFEVSFGTLTLNSTGVAVTATDPTSAFADIGIESTAETDNTINVDGDGNNDLFVLSTNNNDGTSTSVSGGVNAALDSASDLNSYSEETLVFEAGFGRDTVLNFLAGDGDLTTFAGEDVFDFTPVTGVAANTYVGPGDAALNLSAAGIDGEIDWIDLATFNPDSGDVGTDISAAEVAALVAGDATAGDMILIITDSTNLSTSVPSTQNAGQVWHIVDGAAATGDVTATQIGTINLIGTDWSTLTIDNFG